MFQTVLAQLISRRDLIDWEFVYATLTATQAEITRRRQLRTDLDHYRTTLPSLDTAGEFDPATYHVLCQCIVITPEGDATVVSKDSTQINVLGGSGWTDRNVS